MWTNFFIIINNLVFSIEIIIQKLDFLPYVLLYAKSITCYKI